MYILNEKVLNDMKSAVTSAFTYGAIGFFSARVVACISPDIVHPLTAAAFMIFGAATTELTKRYVPKFVEQNRFVTQIAATGVAMALCSLLNNPISAAGVLGITVVALIAEEVWRKAILK